MSEASNQSEERERVKPSRLWGHLAGAGLTLLAFACLPHILFLHFFDRNAAPQFITLLLVAALFAVGILIRPQRWTLGPIAPTLILFLLISALISLVLNHNIWGGIIGDAGRFNGLASLVALITIAAFFSTLNEGEISLALDWISFASAAVTLLGLAQWAQWISLPGDTSIGSTLGNLDFLSAWSGTTLVLVLLHRKNSRSILIGKSLYLFATIFLLITIGAKQGLFDLALLLILFGFWRLRRVLRFNQLSPRFWTITWSTLFLIWCEVIYLVPIARLPIPGIAKDPNVLIRSDFWFSGMQMFFHHILFGVGPDNYGYYYEKYRSLKSVKLTETVISNDAHSAMVQTFGTLGIIGVLLFTSLFIYFIYCLIINFYRRAHERKFLLLVGLFAAIYMTNSLISPITLPNKALFWALCGWVIGRTNLRPKSDGAPDESKNLLRVISAMICALLAIVGLSFAQAEFTFAQTQNAATHGQPIHYRYSNLLPCTMYFSPQYNYSVTSGSDPEKLARSVLAENPRCLDAQAALITALFNQRRYRDAKPYIYELLDIAPGRRAVVRLAAIYAIQTHDKEMSALLVNQGFNLGFLVTHS